MANIGTLAAKLTADDSGFAAVIDRSIKKMGALKDSITNFSAAVAAKNIGTILAGEIGQGVNGLIDQLKGVAPIVKVAVNALYAIPVVGFAVGGAADALTVSLGALKDVGLGALQNFIDMGERGMARIREMTKLSRQLGFSLSETAGLQLMGSQIGDQGIFLHGMAHLRREIAAARSGSLEATVALHNLGVTAQDLERGDMAGIFNRISDSVASSNDPFRTAALMRRAFGRHGEEMMPAMMRGSGVFMENAVRAQQFGVTPTVAESELVKASNRARQTMMADWQALWQGLETRAGVALAPVWKGIAEGFDKVIHLAKPFFDSWRESIDRVGFGLKTMMDGFNKGLDEWAPQIDRIMRAFVEIGNIISVILTGSDSVNNSWEQVGVNVAATLVNGLQQAANAAISLLQIGIGIWQAFKGVAKVVDDIINGIQTAYSHARQAALIMARQADPTGVMENRVRNMMQPAQNVFGGRSDIAGQMSGLQEAERRLAILRRQLNFGQLRSPAELAAERAVNATVNRAVALAQGGPGIGGGGPGITAAMIQGAMNRVTQAPAAPGALALGSAAAVNAINASMREEGDPVDRIVREIQLQLREQQEQTRIHRDVLTRLRELNLEVQGD